MSKVKRLLKIGILFVLFIILAFIIVLAIFSILGKYNLFNNISKMITTVLFTIVAVWFVQFLINKIYHFDEDLDS
ncbi:MAG: hypothetical protein GX231_01625 [Tissierellia bacterium]|nr:hypothetical protein [Tissierellia bacterium]